MSADGADQGGIRVRGRIAHLFTTSQHTVSQQEHRIARRRVSATMQAAAELQVGAEGRFQQQQKVRDRATDELVSPFPCSSHHAVLRSWV